MIYPLLRSLLFRLEPERAHELATAALQIGTSMPGGWQVLHALLAFHEPLLATTCMGLHFSNPLGLAAGFDKHASLINPIAALGFGHLEVGTVTPRPQPGNPQPRMFRLPDDSALINRMGFNSPGMRTVAHRLQHARPAGMVIGVNIGKNRDTALDRATEDYLATFVALAPLADYVAINISSPNTPGLRQLHERHSLEQLLGTLVAANQRLAQPRPLLLKISPDESNSQIEQVVGIGLDAGLAGFIATNTTTDRTGLRSQYANEPGGLSGQPLAHRSLEVTRQIGAMLQGKAALISVGGIWTGADAYARLQAGAQLVQIYTAFVYRGPATAALIAHELAACMRQ